MLKIFVFLLFTIEVLSMNHGMSGILRIYNGEDSDIENVPHYVQIYDAKDDMVFCGGAIISEEWILTAAHCFIGREKKNIRVIAGIKDRYSIIFDRVVHEIKVLTLHSKFDFSTAKNDLALLKLKHPMEINDKQRPVEIRKTPLGKEYLLLAGVGEINDLHEDAQNLETSLVPVINSRICEQWYFTEKRYPRITRNMFCAGGENGHGCKGDSGGPAVDQGGKLVGILSWGRKCSEKAPDVFTNVMNYRAWIQKHTKIYQNISL